MQFESVLIIKLAAMGDVALACRALQNFALRYDAKIKLHWIIDQNLIGLAKELLGQTPEKPEFDIEWHPINSGKLFNGKFHEKLLQAAALLGIAYKTRARHIVLLHRDNRYKLLLKGLSRSRMLSVSREKMHELDAYQAQFEQLAESLRLKKRQAAPNTSTLPLPSKTIGLLIGGAKNQKVTFHDKRWPFFTELIELILSKTQFNIVLFGGADDISSATPILEKLATSRILNNVGKLALEDIPHELAKLDGFISIDSGLAHIASSVMKAPHQKIITLFGPTDPSVWAPRQSGQAKVILQYRQVECSPCYKDDGNFNSCIYQDFRRQHCMKEITPEDVIKSLL